MRDQLEKLIILLHGLQIMDQLVFRVIIQLFVDKEILADLESPMYQSI